mmetsp:Transcript_17577/g.52796  ORF Transcript_17577/g.52796 Transcript_17577/m.52796 type:complete len:95 (-) Transcript_17577:78-362(-)
MTLAQMQNASAQFTCLSYAAGQRRHLHMAVSTKSAIPPAGIVMAANLDTQHGGDYVVRLSRLHTNPGWPVGSCGDVSLTPRLQGIEAAAVQEML